MKMLAIDASTPSGSVALFDDGELMSEFTFHRGGRHSETLLTAIDTICTMSGVEVKEIDSYAVTRGPGSFTGLRVGISTVKGLAWSSGKPVVGVSTLKSLAMNLPCAGGVIVPVLNARRGEVYGGIYRWEKGRLEVVADDCAVAPEAFMERVLERAFTGAAGTPHFLGDGIEICEALIGERLPSAGCAPRHLWSIRASSVGRVAIESGEVWGDASAILPLYKRGMG
ncbi:MAG: tRNA (adenosine(37)-N6)-threonylcarbamoyltransferase complex dimerization subunit type 1 TsaB [Deltaproteobacteria bacterium]|nr:tRNA (adenosine(37)-N6)-threonylcarbamoyltransferase complex dimerization subunit type 1 TsaB [Deltaproteobacteria bacterium]